METIELDEVEWATALYAGVLIHHLSCKLGLTDRLIKPGANPVRINQIGQLGERVVGKALDLYWSGAARTYAGADLSHNIEVRTIGNPKNGLKVRPRDGNDKRVVGVLLPDDLECRKFVVAGWVLAQDAKQKRWGRNPYNKGLYYGVPLHELRPIAELRDIIRLEGLP